MKNKKNHIKPMNFPENEQTTKIGNLTNLPKSSFFDKLAFFRLFFVGPQLAGLSWPGSLGRAKKLKKCAKNGKPKNQETLHKSGPGLMFMGFW